MSGPHKQFILACIDQCESVDEMKQLAKRIAADKERYPKDWEAGMDDEINRRYRARMQRLKRQTGDAK